MKVLSLDVASTTGWCIDTKRLYGTWDLKAFSAKEIKKFATGNGNCGKQAMVDAAKIKYGYKGEDDNIADAMHMLGLFNSEINN